MTDYISREAAIDVLEERLQANGYSNAALVSELNRSIGYLMRLPSARPESKKGKWEQDNPFAKPRCSECGEPCFGFHGFDYTLTPFCPNCGARMER